MTVMFLKIIIGYPRYIWCRYCVCKNGIQRVSRLKKSSTEPNRALVRVTIIGFLLSEQVRVGAEVVRNEKKSGTRVSTPNQYIHGLVLGVQTPRWAISFA